MKTQKLVRLNLVLFLTLAMLASNGALSISAPIGSERPSSRQAAPLTPGAAGPLIVDHTAVDQYDDIPQVWINEVKKMWVSVPGESHSSGYRIGCNLLETLDSRFQVNVQESGVPAGYTDQYLRLSRASWGDVTHATGWRYSYGEEDWYTSAQAVSQTKTFLTYANTNGFPLAALGFGWCWDTTWHNNPGGTTDPVYQVRWAGSSVGGPDGDLRWGLDADDYALTGNRVNMNTYLSATQAYIDHAQANGYPTRVFFTTGPAEGGGESGYQRHLKHEHLRSYVLAHPDVILFDYADILAWSNAGVEQTTSWTDYAGHAQTFEVIHPDNMKDLDGSYTEDGDHIGQRGAVRVAKALWWMLARIAGWDGTPANEPNLAPSSKTASRSSVTQGERITYTIAVRNSSGPISPMVLLTDTLPAGLAYVPGTLAATGGAPNDSNPATLRWSGVLSPTPAVTVTFAVTVTTALSGPITNTAVIAVTGGQPISRTAVVTPTGSALALRGAPGDETIHLTWAVTPDPPPTSTWRIDYVSQTGTAYLPITGLISPTRAYTLTGLTNYVWYTVTLHAMVDSTSWLTDTVRVMPTDQLVYLPLVQK